MEHDGKRCMAWRNVAEMLVLGGGVECLIDTEIR
jgi:hypothetical protein